jgi:hypothetical protein
MYKLSVLLILTAFTSCYQNKVDNNLDMSILPYLEQIKGQIEGKVSLKYLFEADRTINKTNFEEYLDFQKLDKKAISDLFEKKQILSIHANGYNNDCIKFKINEAKSEGLLQKSYEKLYLIYTNGEYPQCASSVDDNVLEVKMIKPNWYLVKSEVYNRIR